MGVVPDLRGQFVPTNVTFELLLIFWLRPKINQFVLG